MNFFSLVRSISPSTACVCVSALTCRVITCLASIWEQRGHWVSPQAFLSLGPLTEVRQARRAEGALASGHQKTAQILGVLIPQDGPSPSSERICPDPVAQVEFSLSQHWECVYFKDGHWDPSKPTVHPGTFAEITGEASS